MASEKKPTKSKKSPPEAERQGKRDYLQRPYPRRSLEEAITLPQKIKEKNNGNPWRTEDLATSFGYGSTKSPAFFYLAASARDYGLTVGTNNTEKIEIAPLGREILYAGTPDAERSHKVAAFFNIAIFKKVYQHYGGSNSFPEPQYLKNTLEKDFALVPDLHDEFVTIFKKKCAYLGIENGVEDSRVFESTDQVDNSSQIRVVGEPKGKFDRTAFVIMPFGEKGTSPRPSGFFDESLKSLVTPAGNNAGFAIETARQHGSDVIQSTIIDQLLQAELVIADLTDHNPNVLFELGIRIAKNLPVALIRAKGTAPIFDVDNLMRVFAYDPNLWPSTVEKDLPSLTDHVKAAWDNRTTNRTYMEILTGNLRSAETIHSAENR